MTKAVAKKPVDKLKAIINSDTVQEQFKNALGKHSDLFVASLIDVYSSSLTNYEPGLVVQEALKAAVLKLPISKSLGFAYIVPYKGKPQFQIGYKGMIQLAMRSAQLKTFNDVLVYKGEFKKFDRMRGIIDLSGERTSGEVTGYLIYMELVNGFEKIAYWTKEQIIDHATAKSPSYGSKNSAWFTDFDAMAMKTVIRSLNKYMPMSVDYIAVMSNDQNDDDAGQSEPEKVGFKDLTDEKKRTSKPSKDTVEDDNKKNPKSDSGENAHTEDSSKTEQTGLTKEEQQKAEQEEEDEYLKAINEQP